MSKSNWFISYVCTPNGPMWTVIRMKSRGYERTDKYFETASQAGEAMLYLGNKFRGRE